ncbi:MAG: hypothetical protein AAF204_04480 [Pseudomonadota bacterium]
MKYFLQSVFVGLLLLSPSHVFAQEDAPEKPAKNEVLAAAEEFSKDFDEMSKRHFTVLYSNYNLIKVVEAVEDSISEAVDECGDKNPDMEGEMDARFKEWRGEVRAVMKEADANVDNMIVAQDYAKARDVRKFLKLIDKSRKERSKEVKKVPVTSPEACQALIKRMDGTQENMLQLLQATLVSLPNAMQVDDEKVKAEAAEKARLEQEKLEKEKEEAERAEAEAQAKAEEEAEKEKAKDE